MNISEEVSFSKDGRIEKFPFIKKLFLSLVILLVAGLSFGIGRLTSTAGNREPVRIEYDAEISKSESLISKQVTTTTNTQTQVIGSKNSDKYHYSHCPGAKQITDKNKVIFASVVVAEASGYSLATNCKPR